MTLPRLPFACAPYHGTVVDPKELKRSVEIAVAHIRKLTASGEEVHAVAGKGISGIPIAGAVAAQLGLYPMFLVSPRDGETRQLDRRYFGPLGRFRFVIVDDMISSGFTLREMLETLAGEAPEARCAAVSLYRTGTRDECRLVSTRDFRVFKRHIRWNNQRIPLLDPPENREALYFPTA
mgnify:CR=1 FL=1